MRGRSAGILAFMVVTLLLTACAPDNLDITPTPVPTPVPLIKVYVTGAVGQPNTMVEIPAGSRTGDALDAAGGTLETADMARVNVAELLRDGAQVHVPAQGEAVAESEPEPTPEAEAVDPNRALVEHIVASLPGQISAGVVTWRRDPAVEPRIVEREGGYTAVRATYGEAGGGLMELTFGVFDTPEIAQAFFENAKSTIATLERSQERDNFPTPNAFGGGTYGWDSIFARENIFLRVSIPRISSTAGDPLVPMARAIFPILDGALESFEAA